VFRNPAKDRPSACLLRVRVCGKAAKSPQITKKTMIRQWDAPKQTGLFEAYPGVLSGLSGRKRRRRRGRRGRWGRWGGKPERLSHGRVRKKKNVRPCSRTFRCSSLSLSVSWRRERLFWLKIKYLPPNKIQGRIFCVTEWPSLNFRVAPCFAYGTAKIGNKMNNPNFSALIFFLFLGGGKKSVKSTKKMPRERRFPGRFLYYI